MEKHWKTEAAFDTETFLFNDQCRIPKMVCGSFAWREKGELKKMLCTDKEVKPILIDMLEDDDLLLIGQNMAFDMAVAAVHYGYEVAELIQRKYEKGLILCTMMNEIYIRLSTDGKMPFQEMSLQFLAKKYLGIRIEKGGDTYRTRYGELYGKPISEYPQAAYDYAIMDAAHTLAVFEAQGMANETDMFLQFHTYWLLLMMSNFGMKTDQEFLEERYKPLNTKIEMHEYTLRKVGFKKTGKNTKYLNWLQSYGVNLEFRARTSTANKCIAYEKELESMGVNIAMDSLGNDLKYTKNTKELKQIIEEACLSLDVPMEFTAGGKSENAKPSLSTKMDFLLDLQGYSKGLDAYINLGSAEFIVNTFLNNWKGKDKVHAMFGIAETGRLTSYDTNMMNLPRKGRIRGVFVPENRLTHCMASIDWGQIELCTLAQILYDMGCGSEMLDAINAKMDLHSLTGSNMLGISYSEFLERVIAEDKDALQFRSLAKVTNFGGGGGMGANTLAITAKKQGVKIDGKFITIAQAKEALKALKKTFPLQKYFDCRKNEIVNTEYGTFYKSKHYGTDAFRMISAIDRKGDNAGYCAANNTPFQNLASSICKLAFRNLCKEAWFGSNKLLTEVNPLMLVHDEFICEIPLKTKHESAYAVSKIMTDAVYEMLPDIKVVKAEPCLMNRWEKEAKPIFDKNGKLDIWIYEKHSKNKEK